MRALAGRLKAHYPHLMEMAAQDPCAARIRVKGERKLCYARWLQSPGWTIEPPRSGDMATARVSRQPRASLKLRGAAEPAVIGE